MKKTGFILIILICLVIGVSIAKDIIIKSSIQGIVSISTGLKMDIGDLRTSIAKTQITIKNTTILNPHYFNDKIMADVPELYIDYDPSSLLKGNIHLYSMRINLKELTIVKDKGGKTNLGYLKSLKKEKEGVEQKGHSRRTRLLIDDLNLKMGTVIYKDYSVDGGPLVSEYRVNIDSRYKNVKDVNKIVRIIIATAVLNTAIGNLTDFRKFRDVGSDVLENGKDILKKTVGELKNILDAPFKRREEDVR